MSTDEIGKRSLALHKEYKGKIAVVSKFPKLKTKEDLSLAYTPGVAEPSMVIAKDKNLVYDYTSKGNMVAIVTDGSAVLGLGNIGPEAALPVMEGKVILFKEFAGVDAFPICLAQQETNKIVETVKMIAPGFGGINLEDIASPRCFEVEDRLKKELDIPVFHDDQHGTAIVVSAGLLNALKIVKKDISKIKIVMSGAGAAGIAVARMLKYLGAKRIILCDREGVIYKGRKSNMNEYKEEIAFETNERNLNDAIKKADVFIGVSVANALTKPMVSSMSKDAIIFAMANPVPEIMPNDAKEAGARIIATGRSDFPNQINNVLAFPGVFRGALDVRAKKITEKMKIAAVYALAAMVKNPKEDKIIPSPFDPDVAKNVADAVMEASQE